MIARKTVPASTVGQGRLSGFWLIAEGPQLENEWRGVKASRATRPMPKQATLGDFLDRNTFAALDLPDSPAQPASPAKLASPATAIRLVRGPVSQLANTARPTTTTQSATQSRSQIRRALTTTNPLLCIEEADDEDQVLAAASEAVKIRVAIDSAAVDHVIHPRDLPSDVEYVPNTSGRHFVGANDAHIEKYGSCQTVLSSADTSIGCQWQMADVNRALHSVARVTGPKDGPGKQDVLFDNEVCVVMPPGTVKEILKRIKPVMQYQREGNLYIAELSMTSMPSFQRQGQGA